MALTLATELANYAAGIGTQGATLKIDSANKRVGVGTTNPQGPEGSLQVGTGITFFGNTGIISAIGGKFSGDFTVGGTLTYEDVQNVNSSGVGTFSGGINVVGGGLTVTGVSTFFSRVSIADSIVHTGDIDTSLRFPAADTFSIETAGVERGRFTSSNQFVLGPRGSARTNFDNGTVSSNLLHIERQGTGSNTGASFLSNTPHADSGAVLYMAKSRSTDNSSATIVSNGDQLGRISFQGADGSNYVEAASIRGHVDGTPGSDDMPGRLSFRTTADGATSATERLRINKDGQISVRGTTTAFDTTGDLDSLQLYYETDSGQASIGPYSSGGSTHLSFYTNAGAAAATEKLRITSAGLVGIGTDAGGASSNTLLTLQATGSTACRFVLANTGSSSVESTQIFSQNNDLAFQTNGSEVVRIDSNGNMGLGVSPSARLHVEEDLTHASTFYLNSDAHILVDNPSSEATAKAVIKLEGDAALVYGGGTNTLIISDRQNERMRIGAGGGVNISGITTATQLFEGTTRVATTGKAIAMAMLFG